MLTRRGLFLFRRRRQGRRSGGRIAGGLAFFHYVAKFNGRTAFVLLVVLVTHGHADGHVFTAFEVQRVGGARVGGEPVFLVDLFAVGFELWKRLVAFDDPDALT